MNTRVSGEARTKIFASELGGLAAWRPILLAIALVGCGGTKAPTTTVDKPLAAAVEPACPTSKTWKLADGKLRCRELPITVDFPANSEIERQDSENLTFIRAALDRGVLAIFVEPRFAATDDDVTGLKKRLEAVVKGIAQDATVVDAAVPPQPGATVSTGISFTTPDGGAGVMYGYLAHGWFIAAIAGGRLAETPARPDRPLGKAFLASVKLRDTTLAWEPRPVFDGMKLDMPLAAWEMQQEPDATGTVAASKLFAAVGERAWIGVRELQPSPACELWKGVTDADVPAIVKKMFATEDLQVSGRLDPNVGTQALYAELVVPGKTMALYLICQDPKVVLVTITGSRPTAELKTTIDRVIGAYRRPPGGAPSSRPRQP